MSDGGKGSRPRPFSVSNEEYANRWDAIFGRDIKKQEEIKPDYAADDGPLTDHQLEQIKKSAQTGK
jgi:hypothetical protein